MGKMLHLGGLILEAVDTGLGPEVTITVLEEGRYARTRLTSVPGRDGEGELQKLIGFLQAVCAEEQP